MMHEYTMRTRNVSGLETNYVEYQVIIIDRDNDDKVVDIIASFIHEACAEGLLAQLAAAYTLGANDVLAQQPAPNETRVHLLADYDRPVPHLDYNNLGHCVVDSPTKDPEDSYGTKLRSYLKGLIS